MVKVVGACCEGEDVGVIKRMSKSSVLMDGECSKAFSVDQGVAQGYSLCPILVSVLINEHLTGIRRRR